MLLLIHHEVKPVNRTWGNFVQFTHNEDSTVKLIYMKKGKSTSLQFHYDRSEYWYVISGKVKVTKGSFLDILLPGKTIMIHKHETHKLEGLEDSIILEISRGKFSEQDIVRLDS